MPPKMSLPSLSELGDNLKDIPIWLKCTAISMPAIGVILFFMGWHMNFWWMTIIGLYVVGFFTYGSTSHELVHGNFGLPKRMRDFLLFITELLMLRSGHAYEVAHINHHQTFPKKNDFEGLPAHWSFLKTACHAPFYFFRIWLWSLEQKQAKRIWILIEGIFIFTYWIIAISLFDKIPVLLAYGLCAWISSWAYPFLLVHLVHNKRFKNPLQQTILIRGKLIPFLLLQHPYHLEHHLYPGVPAYNYGKLAKALDPHFAKHGLSPIMLP